MTTTPARVLPRTARRDLAAHAADARLCAMRLAQLTRAAHALPVYAAQVRQLADALNGMVRVLDAVHPNAAPADEPAPDPPEAA